MIKPDVLEPAMARPSPSPAVMWSFTFSTPAMNSDLDMAGVED
jgi:hypothetical protein